MMPDNNENVADGKNLFTQTIKSDKGYKHSESNEMDEQHWWLTTKGSNNLHYNFKEMIMKNYIVNIC